MVAVIIILSVSALFNCTVAGESLRRIKNIGCAKLKCLAEQDKNDLTPYRQNKPYKTSTDISSVDCFILKMGLQYFIGRLT